MERYQTWPMSHAATGLVYGDCVKDMTNGRTVAEFTGKPYAVCTMLAYREADRLNNKPADVYIAAELARVGEAA
jgi:hypothetical protein